MPIDERLWKIAFSNVGDNASELLDDLRKMRQILESNWEDKTAELQRLREMTVYRIPELEMRIRMQRRELKRLNRVQRIWRWGKHAK
jgi:TolA-binding protein